MQAFSCSGNGGALQACQTPLAKPAPARPPAQLSCSPFCTRPVQHLSISGRPSVRCAVSSVPAPELEGPSLQDLPLPDGNWTANIPLIGESPCFLQDTFTFTMKRVAKHGTVFRTHLFGRPTVFIADYANYKKVFQGDHKLVQSQLPPSVPALLGEASQRSFLDTDYHKAIRRQLSPAFTPASLAAYLPAVEEIVTKFLEDAVRQGPTPLYPLVKNVTFEFASRLLLCIDFDEETRAALPAKFTQVGDGLMSPFMVPFPGSAWAKAVTAREYILEHLEAGTRDTIAAVVAGKAPTRPSLFYQLVRMNHEGGEPLETRPLAHMALALYFGAHDTTAGGYSGLLGFLPSLPRVMEKLREEQQAVMAKHGPSLNQAAMADMPYATACVMEGIRYLGPTRVLFRVALHDFELNGKRIPAGTQLCVDIDAVHALDPALAVDPSRAALFPAHMSRTDLEGAFLPERWLNDATKPTGVGSFGLGPHLCLGMPLYIAEAKALLALVARKYELSLPNGPMKWERTFPTPVPSADTLLHVTHRAA